MTLFAQNDTLVFKNKDVIVGELKELKSNIIIMKTSYSDSDFKIEFDKVASLNLENKYSIILSSAQIKPPIDDIDLAKVPNKISISP